MRHSHIEIDLDRLAENIRQVNAALSAPTKAIFVVKADAYGHGALPLVRRAVREGIEWFAVAYVEEALAIREAITPGRIMVLGVAEPEDVPAMMNRGILPVVVSVEHGRALSKAACAASGRLPVHLKIDTGMGRLGMLWSEAVDQARVLLELPGLDVQGICSHFAKVEPRDPEPARQQIDRFRQVTEAVEAAVGRPLFKHISSSRALLFHPEWDFDGVRPGIIMYGYGANRPEGRFQTRPILQWKTHVMQVRQVPVDFAVGYYGTYVTREPTTLAIIAMGYAEGYLRTLSNCGHVLIRGKRCPVVGRVTMNWITVDAGTVDDIQPGDEVVLIGEQEGVAIWANELAVLCRTIPYEIITGIDAKIERRYLGAL